MTYNPCGMKILVISDIHDDTSTCYKVIEMFEKEKYDKLFILGDIGYSCISIFNSIHEKITAVTGNCDTSYEREEALFDMPYINYSYAYNRFIVLTHGNYTNSYSYEGNYDIFLSGHTHRSSLVRINNGKIVANPGSISCPRDGIRSYISIDEDGLKLYSFDGNKLLDSIQF